MWESKRSDFTSWARFTKNLILNPDLALGEAYTNWTLEIKKGDLFGLLKILAKNAKMQQNHGLSKLVKLR